MSAPQTIAILGGGSAGFTAARVAAKQGARVLFFMGDNADHASLCVNAGCMPSKAIFEPIDAMHRARRQGWLEVKPKQPNEFLAQIVRWKDNEIGEFRAYRQKAIREEASESFQIFRSSATFVSPHEVLSAGQRHRFDAAIIATGSTTTIPKIEGLDPGADGVWTSDEILHNTRLPASLAVIGAGAIGLEFSLRYARLGTRVTLISKGSVLPRYPAQFGQRLACIYEMEGLRVLTQREVKRITRDGSGRFLLETDGAEAIEPLLAETILLAVGRKPALAKLGLKAAGIHLDTHQQLDIGADMRVKGSDHLFAAGDVAGVRMVVHHAHIEAGIAAENACSDGHREWTKRSNIQVVFSDPEFAFAGCKPAEAEKEGCPLVSASAESRDIGKLHLAGDDHGFGEFYADARDGRLISAGLLCDDASNLIHLPAYAIDHEHTVHQLEDAEYYHPTKIEIVAEIGDTLCRKLGGHPFARAEE